MICCLPTVAHPSPRLENTDFYWLFDNSIQNLPTFSSRFSSVPNSDQTSFFPLIFPPPSPKNFVPIAELIEKLFFALPVRYITGMEWNLPKGD